jgi:hypothetical protein
MNANKLLCSAFVSYPRYSFNCQLIRRGPSVPNYAVANQYLCRAHHAIPLMTVDKDGNTPHVFRNTYNTRSMSTSVATGVQHPRSDTVKVEHRPASSVRGCLLRYGPQSAGLFQECCATRSPPGRWENSWYTIGTAIRCEKRHDSVVKIFK